MLERSSLTLREWGRLFQRAGAEDLKERAPTFFLLVFSSGMVRRDCDEDLRVEAGVGEFISGFVTVTCVFYFTSAFVCLLLQHLLLPSFPLHYFLKKVLDEHS